MTQLTGPSEQSWSLRTTSPATWCAKVAPYAKLTKPRLTTMVVITTLVGFAMGAEQWSWLALAATLIGTALSCIGAGVFNQIHERRVDAVMHRTMNRPLPAGQISVTHAGVFAFSCCFLGVVLLACLTTFLVAIITLAIIILYVFVYTPLKRKSSLSTVVGAVPGALPPVVGYVAATGRLGAEAWLLFVIMFVWQLPHFLAIAWIYREDYARANLPVLTVLDPEGSTVFRQILLGTIVLLPLTAAPTLLGISGTLYLFGGLSAAAMFLAFAICVAVTRTQLHARRLFFASLVYLPIVLGLMLVDKV